MKVEPYIFWCSRCKVSHGGECDPNEKSPLILNVGQSDFKGDGWWVSPDLKVWARVVDYDTAAPYRYKQLWEKGHCTSHGVRIGATSWPPFPPLA